MARTKTKKRGTRPSTKAGNSAGGPVAIPKPAPATPGGPNRLARKEEARRQREALRKKMARRVYYRWGAIGVVILLLAGAVTAFAIYQSGSTARALKAAGAGPVMTIRAYITPTEDRTHIGPTSTVKTPPPLSTYSSTPPASGPHDPTPWHAGVYSTPPPIYQMIHSLEHGAVEIWYSPSASGSELTKIKDFYSQASNNDHVIVAPYNYPDQGAAGQLPAGKQMVLVAWHHMQISDKLSLAVAQNFVTSYRLLTGVVSPPSSYKGDAPEQGVPI